MFGEKASRSLLTASSILAEPFAFIWSLQFRLRTPLKPNEFSNCDSKVKEIAVRTLIVLGGLSALGLIIYAPVITLGSALTLGITRLALRALGFALEKDGFIYVRGGAPESSLNGTLKIGCWNIGGAFGGMNLDHVGVTDWRSRLDSIVAKIRAENCDTFFLEEIYDTALAEALIERLGKDYAHIFMHLGPNILGSESGCMVFIKCAVNHFSYTPFKNNGFWLNRGVGALTIKEHPDGPPFVCLMGTHFIHGDSEEAKAKRKEQFEQTKKIPECELPTFLIGDLNIERDQEEGEQLKRHLNHSYTAKGETCTNVLVSQWDHERKSVWGETIDYISMFTNERLDPSERQLPVTSAQLKLKECHLIYAYADDENGQAEAFEGTYNTRTALSDHHGVVATFTYHQ